MNKLIILFSLPLFLNFPLNAKADAKVLTCSSIQLVQHIFTPCPPGQTDGYGNSDICDVKEVSLGVIEHLELTSTPNAGNDNMTIKMATDKETLSAKCKKDTLGGQEEIWCSFANDLSVSYLPSSHEENQYYLAFFVGDGAPVATAENDGAQCKLK